jgi:hypothetical protein
MIEGGCARRRARASIARDSHRQRALVVTRRLSRARAFLLVPASPITPRDPCVPPPPCLPPRLRAFASGRARPSISQSEWLPTV